MPVDALVPNDPRVEHKFFEVGEFSYYYMLAQLAGKTVGTIVLLHGWPDLALGWRFQIPFLASLGLQVLAPDMLGYGADPTQLHAEEGQQAVIVRMRILF
ncbi:hypothetical protein F4809DRAFT_642312 [Biscogniauxia mediterranea]|nr:hypothetical protein F4809DRAFT_642312 [Biscogniauxia mediterranea]